MEEFKQTLNTIFKQSVPNLASENDYCDWAKMHILKIATICMPEMRIEFHKGIFPQDQEGQLFDFRNKLIGNLDQFTDAVQLIEIQLKQDLIKIRTKLDKTQLKQQSQQLDQSQKVDNKYLNVHHQQMQTDWQQQLKSDSIKMLKSKITEYEQHQKIINKAKEQIIVNADELYKSTIRQIKYPAHHNDQVRLIEEKKQ